MENFINLLKEKRNAYVDAMNENEVGSPYWNYCRGKKDIIEDILAYVSENF
jgi:hypothetical protein